MRTKIIEIRRRWAEALPTILVSLFLFMTIMKIFGISQVIMVSFLTMIFRIQSKHGFNIRELVKCYLIQFVIFGAAYLAGMNLILCIVFNLLVPFVIVFMLTDKFNPKAYFVYGMEFVFLQLVPMKQSQVPARIFTLVYGYCVVTAALYVFAHIIKKRRNYGTVRKGINHMAMQAGKLAEGRIDAADGEALGQMMYHMNQVIYASRNYNYMATGYGIVNYYFMILFQRFRYFVKELSKKECSLWNTPQNSAYFIKLSEIFYEVEKEINTKDNVSLIEEIQGFRRSYELHLGELEMSMNEILELLCFALRKMTEVNKNRPEKEWKIPNMTHKIKGISFRFHLSQFQMRFALRLAVVLCISFTFCRAVNLEHSYWYPMSAFLMLMPYSEESTMKMSNRMIGTITGLGVTYFLTEVFKTLNAHIVIILIMTCMMYYAPVTSWTMTMYSTCYGMALTTLSLPRGEAIGLRFVYVLGAVATVLLANRFILPNTAKSEFLKSVNDLFDIDKAMVKEVRKGKESDLNVLRELNVQYNLSEEDISNYIEKYMKPERQEFYRQLLIVSRQLVSEIEQIGAYMRKYKQSEDDGFIVRELLGNIEGALEQIRISYSRKELNGSIITGAERKTYGSLDEELYFNKLALNCLGTVQNMLELFEKR